MNREFCPKIKKTIVNSGFLLELEEDELLLLDLLLLLLSLLLLLLFSFSSVCISPSSALSIYFLRSRSPSLPELLLGPAPASI